MHANVQCAHRLLLCVLDREQEMLQAAVEASDAELRLLLSTMPFLQALNADVEPLCPHDGYATQGGRGRFNV